MKRPSGPASAGTVTRTPGRQAGYGPNSSQASRAVRLMCLPAPTSWATKMQLLQVCAPKPSTCLAAMLQRSLQVRRCRRVDQCSNAWSPAFDYACMFSVECRLHHGRLVWSRAGKGSWLLLSVIKALCRLRTKIVICFSPLPLQP